MANERRGEYRLTLGGRALTLEPNFANLSKVETELQRSVVDVVKQVHEHQNLPLGELAVIVYLLATKPKPKLETVGDLVLAEGVPDVMLHVATALIRGIGGRGADDEEEEDDPGKAEGDPS